MNEHVKSEAGKIGYKAAKLNWLKTQLKEEEQQDFCFLDSRHFTHEHTLTCVDQTFKNTDQAITPELIAACYKQKKLTLEVAAILNKRRELFQEKLSNSPTLKSIVESEIIKHFSPDTYLILRSSSNEDIKGSPNAGGNETRQGVKNEWDCIQPELVRVLCSYFSEDSLNQQLQTAACFHDVEKLLTTLPTLAVLIQQCLRTEQEDILITGNLISVEPITNIPNTVTIQAGFGAEVGTRPEVPADKYTVMSDNFIIPSIKNKSYRLQSSEKVSTELVRVKNDFELATRSTLEKDQILKLARLARRIKHILGCDVEMEFALHQNKIVLLQIREYQQNTCTKPQYLSNAYFHESPNHRLCTALTSMKEHVIVFKNTEALSGFPAIEAVRRYAALPDKTKIKAIFVTDRPGLLSHPMVNFQHWGVPVYYVDTTKGNANFTKSHIVIDFQRQELINTDTPPNEGDIENGWHSMPFSESVSSDCGKLNEPNTTALRKLLPKHSPYKLIEALLDEQSEHTPDNLISLCNAVMYFAAQYLDWRIIEEEHRGNFRAAVTLAIYLKEHAQDEDTVELLFYRTVFLKLLTQTPEKNHVRTHGFVMLLKEFKTLQASPQVYFDQTEFEEYQLLYTKFERLIEDTAQKEKFYLILSTLLIQKETLRKFNAIVSVFSKLSLLSAWFNYLISLDEPPKILEHINTLFEQLGTENTLFNSLLILQQRLNLLEDTGESEQFYKLSQALLVFACKLNLVELKEKGLPFTIPAILALLLRAVNTYDVFIKKLILAKQSAIVINKVLFNYALLTLRILKLLATLVKRKIDSKTLENTVFKLIKSTSHELSPDFDVRLYITNILNINLNHVKKYSGGSPHTAHDLLTLLHKTAQTAIAEIGQLTTENNPFDALENFNRDLVALGKRTHEVFRYTGADDAKLLLKTSDDIAHTCQYLFPLRFHGILVTVSKKRGTHTLDIDIKLFADNQNLRNTRLDQIVTLIAQHLSGTRAHTSTTGEEGYSLSFKADDTFEPNRLAELIYIIADISCSVDFNFETAYKLILGCEQTALKKITLTEREQKKLCQTVVAQSLETKTLHPLLSYFLLDEQAKITDLQCETLAPVLRNAQQSFNSFSNENTQTRGHFLDCLTGLVRRGHGLVLGRETLETVFSSGGTLAELSNKKMAGRYVRLLWAYEESRFRPLDDKHKKRVKKYFEGLRHDQALSDLNFLYSLLDYLLATNHVNHEDILEKYSGWVYHKVPIEPRHLIQLPSSLQAYLIHVVSTLIQINMANWLGEKTSQTICDVIDAFIKTSPTETQSLHALLIHIDTLTETNKDKRETIKKHIMQHLFNTVEHYELESISARMFTESAYLPPIFFNHCLFRSTGKKLSSSLSPENYIKEALALLSIEEQTNFFLSLFNLLNTIGNSASSKSETAQALHMDFHLALNACLASLPPSPAISQLQRMIFCNLMQLRTDYCLYTPDKLPEGLFENLLLQPLDNSASKNNIKIIGKRLISLLNNMFENYAQDLRCGFNAGYLYRTIAAQNMTAIIIKALSQLTPFLRKLFYKNREAYDFFTAILEKSINFVFRKEKPADQIAFYNQHIKAPLQALQHALPSSAELFPDVTALAKSSSTLAGASAKKRDEKKSLEKHGDPKKPKEDNETPKDDDEQQEGSAAKKAKK